MQQYPDSIRTTIREAQRAGHTIRLTLDDTESFVARTYGIRKRPGGPMLNYFDVDASSAGELPLARIVAVENLGRPLADVVDDRLMQRERGDDEWEEVELPPDLVKRIDGQRGTTPRDRYVLQAVEARLYRDARGW